MRLAVCGLVIGILLTSSSLGAEPMPAPSDATKALPDCTGKMTVRPAQVILACADANLTASKLKWTGWGEAFTAGRGTASVNDCTPNCAAGHFHQYPVVLIVDGSQTCPGDRAAYSRVTLAWIGRSPFGTNSAPTIYPTRCEAPQ